MSVCELCTQIGGELLWEEPLLRIVRVEDPLYPGFLRVICRSHHKEMTDLGLSDRQRIMQAVFAAEQALRETLSPHVPDMKINLASLGNVTPHVHWHVIVRVSDDPHFPTPIWGPPLRDIPHLLPAGWIKEVQERLVSLMATGDD